MREELLGPKVEGVAVAIVKEIGEGNQPIYNSYLLNLRDDIMEGVIITTCGYGENLSTGEKITTSTLRHCLEILLPDEAAKIEPIMEEVFGLNNEFWVRFYDKKFVFLPESIQDKNMKLIPKIGLKGVIIM